MRSSRFESPRESRDNELTHFIFTDRGRVAVLALLVAMSFALVFLDFMILLVSLFAIAILVYDYLKVHSTIGKIDTVIEVDPDNLEETLTAGDTLTEELTVGNSSGLPLNMSIPIEDASLTDFTSLDGATSVDLFFTPDLAGKYELEELDAELAGPLGLVEGSEKVPFKSSFHVRPRVLAAAVRAARFLTGAEGRGKGSKPTDLKGAGLEYAGSREYQPGDELRYIDWKATARLGNPIVKEFYMEGGGGVHLVYDAKAPDPVSLDRLSASFLNATIAVAGSDVPVGLTVHDERNVIISNSRMDPQTAVAQAMRYSLETSEVEMEELYSVLEPRTSREVRSILQDLEKETMQKFVSGGGKILERTPDRPEGAIRKILRNSEENLQIGVVSSLMGDISPLLEIRDFANQNGSNLNILQPAEPWKHADTLEGSYRFHEKYSRANRVLRKRGIPVDADLEEFVKTLNAQRVPETQIEA